MFSRFKAFALFSALISALIVCVPAQAKLAPEPIYKQTLLDIVTMLDKGHYNHVPIDDQLSSRLLDRYLDHLDPTHSYFYASDVAGFEQWRHTLDDQINKGELSAAYAIFNRFEQRNLERLNYLIDRLSDDSVKYDFTKDETLNLERKNAPWIDSQSAMNDLWRKRLKNAMLSLILADKTVDEARTILLKRYKSQKQRVEQTNSEDVFQIYVNSLTSEYDPHTTYFTPEKSQSFNIDMSLSLEGIGAVLQSQDDMVKIVSLVPGGPAEKSGKLKPADLIVGVGQGDKGPIEDVVGWRLDDVVKKIRGPKDTVVRLEIIPADATDHNVRKTVRLVRSKVKLEDQAAHSRVLNLKRNGQVHKIGVIKVPAFYLDFTALQNGDPNYRSTTRDVKKLIEKLKAKHVEGLIIDLRNNGGGSLREANDMVGLFISRGPTVQVRDSSGRIDILGDFDPSVAWNGPMTVLVNRLSASASEIFTGAIKDYHRGLIVGSRTFGKGTVQTVQPVDHGQLKLTHAKFYRISGKSTQLKGVEPDIQLPTTYDEKQVGESALDDALPWDQVRAVRHGFYPSLDNYLPQLRAMHKQRVAHDPDFVFMREQVAHLKKEKHKDSVSLNEKTLRKERKAAEDWLLASENRRRKAKHEAPAASLSALEESLPKDKSGHRINPDAEALLHESAAITLDLIKLEEIGTTTAQNQKSG